MPSRADPRLRRPGLKTALVWIGLLVTVAFGYLAVRNVEFDEVWRALRTSDYWWAAPSLALLAAAVWMRAVRWRLLFAPGRRPSLRAVTSALLVGYFFNSILPARAGEAARVVALKQRDNVSRAEALATVVTERAYDVLCLLVLLFATAAWLPHVSWLRAAAALALAVVVALVAGVVLLWRFGERPVLALLRPLGRLPAVGPERVERLAASLVHGLAGLRRPRLVAAALLWTTGSWLLIACSWWLLMLGFDFGLSLLAALLVVVATNLAMILPSSPSGLGVFEAAAVVALAAYGVSRSEALSYALVLHAVNFVPYLVAGPLVLHRHAVAVRRRASTSSTA